MNTPSLLQHLKPTSIRKSHLLAISAALVVACAFGADRNVVSHSTVATAQAVAVNVDGNALFVADLGADLVVTNPSTGTQLARHSFATWGSNWNIVSLTSDRDNSDSAWALHDNGYALRWRPTATWAEYVPPRPMGAASARYYCSIDRDSAGNLFITSVDTIGGSNVSVLARHDVMTNVWTTVYTSDDACNPVAYDDLTDDVVVFREGSNQILRYTTNLVLQGTATISGGCAGAVEVNDIDALNGTVLAGGMCWTVDPHPALWMFDADTGALVDSEPDNVDWINAVQFADYASSYLEAIVGGYDPYITVRAYEITS